MAELVVRYPTVSKKTDKPHPLWRYEYADHLGRKRKGTGTTSRKETVRAAPASQLNPNGMSGQATAMHKALSFNA